MAKDFMITTVDNVYDPFTHFNQWMQFDLFRGYDTCGRLARMARLSESFSEEEITEEIDDAMNRLIEIERDPITGESLYKKVYEDSSE